MGNRKSEQCERAKYVISDLLMSTLAVFIIDICRYYLITRINMIYASVYSYLAMPKVVIEQIMIPFALLFAYWLSGFYNQALFKSRLGIVSNSIIVGLIASILIYLIVLINDIGDRSQDYLILLVMWLVISICPMTGRMIINAAFVRKLKQRKVVVRCLIMGNSETSRQISSQLIHNEAKIPYEIIGYVEIPGENSVRDAERVWKLHEVEDVSAEMKPDQFVIAPQKRDDQVIMDILDRLIHLNRPIRIAPNTLSYITSAINMGDILGTPFVDLTTPRLDEFQKNLKRFSDVVISMCALIVMSPLMLALTVIIKSTSQGPALYFQERLGKHRRPFRIIKFRSMLQDAESDGPRLTSDNDRRMTAVGRIMRKYRLDELPQFINVIRGDMSLVGPRPEREYYARKIMKHAPYYGLIFQVRPGITSWGMVKYGYASDVDQMVERSRYDLLYLNNMSISTDLKILMYTIRTVITGEGK